MLPFKLIKDTPYLALSGELWSVFYEYFNRNWSCYRGFLLYHIMSSMAHDIILSDSGIRQRQVTFQYKQYDVNLDSYINCASEELGPVSI